MANLSTVNAYDLTLGRAGQFLRSRQEPDGTTPGADSIWGYYSQPLAFLSAGSVSDWNCANRCLDLIQRDFLTDNGTLQIEAFPLVGDLYPYPYLIRGAATWGRVDMAVPLTRFLLRFQDECGGFYYRMDDPSLIDPAVTAHGGISLILTGHLREAERAGQYFTRLHDLQPDPDGRYLTVWDTKSGRLLSDYGAAEDVPWGLGSQLVRDNPQGGNAYWDIGYMMAFLTALFQTAGDRDYLRVAEEMFDVVSRYKGFHHHVWKTSWGCAALYQATGKAKYLQAATAMADEIVKTQEEDGGFFLGDQSCYVDDAEQQWSYAFGSYQELQDNVPILMDTAAQMMHYLAQVRAVL